MSNRQDLPSKLVKARQQLKKAQARVADLEAQLFEDRPTSTALLASEERYHRTLDNMLEGCQIIGFDWRYLYVNDIAAKYGRQTKDELLGHLVMERYPGIENTKVFAVMQQCMKERIAQDKEVEFTYPDGSKAWFESRIQPVPEGICILTLDITERKEALEEIHNLANFPGENANPVLSVARDSTLLYANPASYRLLALWGCEVGTRLPEDLQQVVSESFATEMSKDVEVICGDIYYSLTFVLLLDSGYANIYGQDITKHKLAQEILRRSEERYRFLFEHMLNGLAYCKMDFDQGRPQDFAYLEVNRAFETLTGLKDVVGKNVSEVIPGIRESDPELFEIYGRVALTGHPEKFETYVGSLGMWFSISVYSPEKEYFVAVFDVITERKQAEAALRIVHDTLEQRVEERTAQLQVATERVEAILNNSVDGILLVHSDFTIQRTNIAFNRLFACKTDDYFGRPLFDLIHADVVDRVASVLHAVIDEQTGQRIEVRAKRKDGTDFDAEFGIGFIKGDGFVCSIQNITERKAQEHQLRYHASLQENVSDAVIVTNTEFRIQSWNRAAERIYGWPAEEVVNKATAEMLRTQFSSPDDRERNIQQLREQGWWQGEVIQHHKDGSIRHILGSVTLVKDKNGVPFCIVAVNHDITERQKAEEALRESEARYRLLAENVTDMVVRQRLDSEYLYVSPSSRMVVGYDPEDLVGRRGSDNIHPDDHFELQKTIRGIGEQHLTSATTTFRFRHKDGHYIWLESTGQIIFSPTTGEPLEIIASARDVTERKRAEEALQRFAAEIHDLYNNAPCGYHSLDKDGVIVQINDTELRWLGYHRDEVVGRLKITDIFTPESVLNFQKNFPLFKERGWVNDLEFDVIRKDGSIMHILLNGIAIYDEHGQYLKSRSSVFDITQLQQAQQELVESEVRYRLLAENVIDVIAKTRLDGILTFITPSIYALLGYAPEALLGRPVSEIVHPDDLPNSQSIAAQSLASSKASFTIIQRLRHKAGHYISVEITNSVVRDSDTGRVLDFIGVIRDITERKRAEAALNARMREDHEFQTYLKALHEIMIELAQIDHLDEFYRHTVELGLQRLGIERLSLYLYDAENNSAVGTYGTDPQGKPVAEHHLRFLPAPDGIMGRAFRRVERFYLEENVRLSGSHEETLGIGWNAAAILWNGTQSLGWLVADNLLSQTPASKPVLDILGLYALTVGTLLAQKQVQIALRESETRYRLLAENITDMIVRVTAEGVYRYVSPSCKVVLGYDPEEVIGKSILDFIHPDDILTVQTRRQETLEQGASIPLPLTYRFRHHDGHYIWIEVVRQLIHSDNTGEVQEYVASARDVTDRKQAEEALRESEEKFRLLLDAAPVATIISDQMGRITLVNVQAETLFGFSRAELVGQMVEVLVPEYARDSHIYNRATFMAAPRVRHLGSTLELFALHKDASQFPIEIELSYIETKDSIMVMSFIVDITERKQVAAELERQRSFLRNVIDVSPSMIFVKDYDARFVLVNPMFAKMYNTTVEALIGKTDADFNPSLKEVGAYLEADRRVIATGEPLFIEEPITNFAGETHWLQTTKVSIISADGKSKYVLGISTDLTERKRAEAALQESEEKYRLLVETMQGGLAVYDLEEQITYVNDRFCDLLGYTRDELIGTSSYDYVDTANTEKIKQHLEYRHRSESTSYELVVKHKDGQPIYFLVSGSPLLDKEGQLVGSFAVMTDITTQKQAEAVLRQAFEKEKELGELKTRFVSMASHEFRTPLATILAVSETLSAYRHKLTEDQIAQRLEKIKDQVGHLKDIMEDVLLLARMQARRVEFNPVKLDPDAVCRSVLDEFQGQTEVKHRLEYICGEAVPEVKLDRKLMRQVINNLVSNAIKYSSESQAIKVCLEYASGAIVLSVKDEGIGIPEADLKHLFEPFHRATNVGTISGTGLGLVITKEAVELHGGTITVDSQLGIGTTFVVRVPAAAPEEN